MRRLLLAIALCALASAQASADGAWRSAKNGGGVVVNSPTPERPAWYYVPAASTTDSVPINTSRCLSLTLESIIGGVAPFCQVDIRTVDDGSDACSTGRYIGFDADGGGVDTGAHFGDAGLLNGDHGEDEDGDTDPLQRAIAWDFGPISWICIDVKQAPTSSSGCNLKLMCGR